MDKTWINDDFWGKKAYDVEQTVALAFDGDCLIYPDGNFQFLGNHHDLIKYANGTMDENVIKRGLDSAGIVLWLNISDDYGIIVPSKLTDEQKQVITAIKDAMIKIKNMQGRTK